MRALFALAFVVLFMGCVREQGPDTAYRALVKAVADRDEDAAWALLSRASQKQLDAKARLAAVRAPGVVAPSGKRLLIGEAANLTRPISSIAVVRETPERVVLKVEVEGALPAEVTLVREGGWRVELPGVTGS